MIRTAVLGYPRMGADRELKKALESYWAVDGDRASAERALLETAARIRSEHWKIQKDAGLTFIPSGDFSFYDHVLDTAAMVGTVAPRFGAPAGRIDLGTYFAMARGGKHQGADVTALEMTKWFDTNYHYLVPEIEPGTAYRLSHTQTVDHYLEARKAGLTPRPVLLGPVTFLALSKGTQPGVAPLATLDALLPVYEEVLRRLADAGAEWVQMDEPILVTDLPLSTRKTFDTAYARLGSPQKLKIMLTTYFGDLRENIEIATRLPVAGLHLDLVRGPDQLKKVLRRMGPDKVLSLGVVDGRNIWKTDLDAAIERCSPAVEALGSDRLIVAPSCSLLHCPEDLDLERDLDPELKSWLAFSRQKLGELSVIAGALDKGRASVAAQLEENRKALATRRASPRVTNPRVRERIAGLKPSMARRAHAFSRRKIAQQAVLGLPLYPTTTIGSFPQTAKLRSIRAAHRARTVSLEEYEAYLRQEIESSIRLQEKLGIDVLVHGEFERNDMVEHFGQMLSGFAFTRNGWVQSYGSRCVKPPVVYGDVERPAPMTVSWSKYAQSLTPKPVKGMLTGPVTILAWSFIRDDQPLSVTCRQIALAIRDEVRDLEAAGLKVIQIDEPALREKLPLRQGEWKPYLKWAVECFRLAAAVVADATQIHTHMCYGQFEDILSSIAAMDADVISIESARSGMELLRSFRAFRYPNQIGPGVYDIHSPRVPGTQEMRALLEKASSVLSPHQLWVNPDCGLKTRGWKEVEPSLQAMVQAALELRKSASR